MIQFSQNIINKINNSSIFQGINDKDMFLYEFQNLLQELEQILRENIQNNSIYSELEIRNTFFAVAGESFQNGAKQGLINILKRLQLNSLQLNSWIGPQSIGKGALINTINYLIQTFVYDGLNQIDIFNEDDTGVISKYLSNLEEKDKKDIANFLLKILGENVYEIKTGTGGIMRTSSDPEFHMMYKKYLIFEKYTEDITSVGHLFEDSWVNGMVLLEIVYGILDGKKSFSLDVWPRNLQQLKLLDNIEGECKNNGIFLNRRIFHLEPVENKNFFIGHKNDLLSILDIVGELLSNFMIEIDKCIPLNLDKFAVKYLSNVSGFIPRESLVYFFLSENIGKFFEDHSNKIELKNKEKLQEITNGISLLLKRVGNRVYSKRRPDDLDYIGYLRRLSIYYKNTSKVAIQNNNNLILPVGGDYDIAIHNQLNSLLSSIGNDLNPLAKRIFTQIASFIYLKVVTPK